MHTETRNGPTCTPRARFLARVLFQNPIENPRAIRAGAANSPGIDYGLGAAAVRNLERAGVSRSDAMKMVGHKTESIYRRYAIADEKSMKEAAGKLDQFYAIDQQPTETSK